MIQGGILSPNLFNIFVNDLITELKKEGIFINVYADDLSCVGLGLQELNRTIKIIYKWIEKNNISINHLESGIIFHNKRVINSVQVEDGKYSKIPIVDSYKYLGVIINKNLTFRE